MDNAIFLASIFGPLLAIVGFWMVAFHEHFSKVVASMKATPGAFYLGGVLNLLIGIVIISTFNEWEWDAHLLVTLVGWVMLFRGVMILFVPHLLVKWTMSDTTTMKAMGVLPFVWGLALCWFAFLR